MTNLAIRVENLSKQYRIGGPQAGYKTIRETITDTVQAPFRRVGKLLRGQAYGAAELDQTIWALKDVSFEVKPGEVVGIIGRNGAGKTTLLKILSRITEPTEGTVDLYGRVGSLLEVGTGFHPELTGRENITLNGAILGMRRKEIDSKFDEIVDFAEIEKFIDTPVKHYSSGMYVRLAFAVAAHLEPEILLVDEVLAVGDVAFQKKCLGKMDDVSKQGRTILFVSHNMGAIKQLCTRSILLENGKIKQIGPTKDMVSLYLEKHFSDSGSEYIWEDADVPDDESAKIRSIRLCSASGETRSEFGTNEKIFVEVKYNIFENVHMFRVGLSLYSSNGIYIFYTSDSDSSVAERSRKPGEYLSRCEIPAFLLNKGVYVITIGGGLFGVRSIFNRLPNLSFTIIPTEGPTISWANEDRHGVLSPNLSWEIIRDSSNT